MRSPFLNSGLVRSKTRECAREAITTHYAGDEKNAARAANKSRSLGPHILHSAPKGEWDLIQETLRYFGVAVRRFLLAETVRPVAARNADIDKPEYRRAIPAE